MAGMVCAVHGSIVSGTGGVQHIADGAFAGGNVRLTGVDMKLDEFAAF